MLLIFLYSKKEKSRKNKAFKSTEKIFLKILKKDLTKKKIRSIMQNVRVKNGRKKYIEK